MLYMWPKRLFQDENQVKIYHLTSRHCTNQLLHFMILHYLNTKIIKTKMFRPTEKLFWHVVQQFMLHSKSISRRFWPPTQEVGQPEPELRCWKTSNEVKNVSNAVQQIRKMVQWQWVRYVFDLRFVCQRASAEYGRWYNKFMQLAVCRGTEQIS